MDDVRVGNGPVPEGWFTIEQGAAYIGCSRSRACDILRNKKRGGVLDAQWWMVDQRRALIYRERAVKGARQ